MVSLRPVLARPTWIKATSCSNVPWSTAVVTSIVVSTKCMAFRASMSLSFTIVAESDESLYISRLLIPILKVNLSPRCLVSHTLIGTFLKILLLLEMSLYFLSHVCNGIDTNLGNAFNTSGQLLNYLR